jgi:uncharacterized small protein (DUF1192 family)
MTDTTCTESAIGKIREQLEIIAEEHRVALCKQAEDTCDTPNTDQTRADVEALRHFTRDAALYHSYLPDALALKGSLNRAIAALQRQEEMAKEIERLKAELAQAKQGERERCLNTIDNLGGEYVGFSRNRIQKEDTNG